MEVIPYFYDFTPEEPDRTPNAGSDGRSSIAAVTLRLLCLTTIAALVGSVADGGLAAPDTARRDRASTPMLMAQQADDGTLNLEDSGEAVSQLQQQLAELGFFNGEVTGFYGEQTEAAVQQFQQENGLTADGVVGAATADAIRQQLSDSADSAAGEAQSVLQPGDRGEQVEALQQRLSDLGYYTGGISGNFDSATQAAVIEFQTANGLTADGVVGSATETALRRPSEDLSRPETSDEEQAESQNQSSRPTASANLLRLGDTGEAVSALQTRLRDLGYYSGPISGNFGPQTESAVMALQRAEGLTDDGIVGPQVNSALAAANGTSDRQTSNSPGTRSVQPAAANPQELEQARQQAEQSRLEAEQARLEADQARTAMLENLQEGRFSVVELQRRLQSRGFNPGPINGILGSETQQAVQQAQQSYGLSERDLIQELFPPSTSSAPAVTPALQASPTPVSVPEASPQQPF